MSWIFAAIGLLIGLVIGYLLSERRLRGQLAATQEQLRQLELVESRFREAFASLSADALARNNEAFLSLAREKFTALSTEANGSLEQRKTQIEALLAPMQEVLNQYQARLADIEKSRIDSYASLRDQVGALNLQTSQLVNALRRPQTRGQWGEMTLRRLVEIAGMSAHCDFTEQMSIETDQGRQRPDMVVQLPGDRQIVLDSKTVLDAFLDASTTSDDQTRQTCLKRHAEQVRARATSLSTKAYQSQFDSSPEFVVMFLPSEAFLYAAVEQDQTLLEDCMKSGVIIATPTTLLALLKAVAYGWRQEQVAQNAEEIRNLGTELYDRLVLLLERFEKLGGSIDMTVKSYNELIGSLEARVLVSARKMGELGARSDEELPLLEPIDRQTRDVSV